MPDAGLFAASWSELQEVVSSALRQNDTARLQEAADIFLHRFLTVVRQGKPEELTAFADSLLAITDSPAARSIDLPESRQSHLAHWTILGELCSCLAKGLSE